jgi:hypothetical protein
MSTTKITDAHIFKGLGVASVLGFVAAAVAVIPQDNLYDRYIDGMKKEHKVEPNELPLSQKEKNMFIVSIVFLIAAVSAAAVTGYSFYKTKAVTLKSLMTKVQSQTLKDSVPLLVTAGAAVGTLVLAQKPKSNVWPAFIDAKDKKAMDKETYNQYIGSVVLLMVTILGSGYQTYRAMH